MLPPQISMLNPFNAVANTSLAQDHLKPWKLKWNLLQSFSTTHWGPKHRACMRHAGTWDGETRGLFWLHRMGKLSSALVMVQSYEYKQYNIYSAFYHEKSQHCTCLWHIRTYPHLTSHHFCLHVRTVCVCVCVCVSVSVSEYHNA